jgi:hypothetical protein
MTENATQKWLYFRFATEPASFTRLGYLLNIHVQHAKRVYLATADQAEPSNLHKPKTCDRHLAGSFPRGFRTPAPVQLAASVMAGIRNPSQQETFGHGNL